jgi:polyisoprenoid-binding protein YceI
MGRVNKAWSLLALLAAAATARAQDALETYTVVPEASDVHWLVYKAGALARLGHNHTIAVGGLRGTVSKHPTSLVESRFALEFDVADLVVDDPELRGTLGEEFASVPSAEDIAGTRGNMLGENVLDAEKHPTIRITGTGPMMANGMQTLAATVELQGRSVPLTIPTRVVVAGDEIRATGEFELNHADLGMKPFSVMMGALQVGEKLSFSYEVTARRAAR